MKIRFVNKKEYPRSIGILIRLKLTEIGIGLIPYPWVDEQHFGKDYFSFWERLFFFARPSQTWDFHIRYMWLGFGIRRYPR